MYGGSAGSRTQVQKAFNPDHYLSILFIILIPRTMWYPVSTGILHQSACLIESIEAALTQDIPFLCGLIIFFVHNNHPMVTIPRMPTNADTTSIRSRVFGFHLSRPHRCVQIVHHCLNDCHSDFGLYRLQSLYLFFISGVFRSVRTKTR